jgi:hypothetical protein
LLAEYALNASGAKVALLCFEVGDLFGCRGSGISKDHRTAPITSILGQAQGVAKAKAEGKYLGRLEDTGRNAGIASMLRAGSSWTAIQAAFGCSRATIAKVAKRAAPQA